jgi:hypothetical protein
MSFAAVDRLGPFVEGTNPASAGHPTRVMPNAALLGYGYIDAGKVDAGTRTVTAWGDRQV